MKTKDLISEYHDIYCKHYENGKVYGRSSEDLLPLLAPHVIKLNPKTILDYGCGRSSLIHYFWKDGQRELYKYDPAIREYRIHPKNKYDLVVCTDVLEHVLEDVIPIVLSTIKKLSENVIFSVSTVPARQKLSNGMNAHVTIKPNWWWYDFIDKFWGNRTIIKETDKGAIFKTYV